MSLGWIWVLVLKSFVWVCVYHGLCHQFLKKRKKCVKSISNWCIFIATLLSMITILDGWDMIIQRLNSQLFTRHHSFFFKSCFFFPRDVWDYKRIVLMRFLDCIRSMMWCDFSSFYLKPSKSGSLWHNCFSLRYLQAVLEVFLGREVSDICGSNWPHTS